ncbi:hypothetical protein HK414_03420 [Ramlibacter terrae]|uniref:Lipoprotein n=1 Tax=Ramlibacter terrae TaxID=2732511 RepID=A0ABX6P2B0_9BURK|nr:hypothetical protein HK414_03420 [Ramlibacter terrae]
MKRIVLLFAAAALLAACGNKPRQPDWLVNADGAQERYQRAYLSGRDRVATAEFARLRSETASTGDPGVVARAELTRCAMRVASLDFQPCTGFEPLRRDAGAAERAYADFWPARCRRSRRSNCPGNTAAGRRRSTEEDRGPGLAADRRGGAAAHRARRSAGAAGRDGHGVGTRLAARGAGWLGAQAMRADQAGATDEAQRLRRRMELAAEEK